MPRHGYHGRRPSSSSSQPRRSTPKPPWNENFTSSDEFKATEEELRRRHEAHKSKNFEKARIELRRSQSRGELSLDSIEMLDGLKQLSYSEPKLYAAEPLVTPAPGGSPMSEGFCSTHSRAEPLHWNPQAPSLYEARQLLRQRKTQSEPSTTDLQAQLLEETQRREALETTVIRETRRREKLETALAQEVHRRQSLEVEVTQMRILIQELTKDVIALNAWRQQQVPPPRDCHKTPPTPAIPLGPPIRYLPFSPDNF